MAARLLGFVCLLCILGLSGYAAVDAARRGDFSPAKRISEEEQRLELESARYVLGVVAKQLEELRTVSGTYSNDLDFDNFPLVTLVHANETSYCLEFEKTTTYVLRGPQGTVGVGRCT
jgi:hypothetical protein